LACTVCRAWRAVTTVARWNFGCTGEHEHGEKEELEITKLSDHIGRVATEQDEIEVVVGAVLDVDVEIGMVAPK
jgi:hypothetical protein